MNEIILNIKNLNEKEWKTIWIQPAYLIKDFMQEWSHYSQCRLLKNEMYLIEEHRFLNPNNTVQENQLCDGDHCIVL